MRRVSASGTTTARRATLCLLIVAASCAPPRVTLPTGTGTPFPDFLSAYTQAAAECRAVRTMSASMSLAGRAGSTKLAARIDAGFAEPARLRLEGYPRVNFGGIPGIDVSPSFHRPSPQSTLWSPRPSRSVNRTLSPPISHCNVSIP